MRSSSLAPSYWGPSKLSTWVRRCLASCGQILAGSLLLWPVLAQASAGTSYRAHSITGEESPPQYGLRLDGFYDGNAHTEVTFGFDDVFFDQYNDGTALLRGEISVAEHNTSGAPGSQNVGPGSHGDERYLLNVHFVQITDPAKIAVIEGYRADWTYYEIDPTGVEMQRIGSSSDSTHLWMYPANYHMPFQVGQGANGKNQNFGAAGWLSFKHYKYGKKFGGGPGSYLDASDFLMDLVPAEPGMCDSVKIVDNFTMQFQGVIYDYAAGTSRWEYELTWDGSPPDLSHLVIELCKDLTHENLVSSVPSNGHIGREGSTGLYGIKWDPPPHMSPGVPVRFSFTLNRLLDVDEAGFFPKASINNNYALICGPALDCREIGPPCESNLPPLVVTPPVPDPIRCVPTDGQVCIEGWVVTDPEGDALTYNTSGSGTFNPATGTFCRTVDGPGQYTMSLAVSDPCGGTSTATLTFEVVENDPPVVTIESDEVFLCLADTVCVGVTVSDENPESLLTATNLGLLANGQVCFAADTSGVYTVIVTATDECGLMDADTSLISVSVNEPPSIVFSCPSGARSAASGPPLLFLTPCDETVFICEGQTEVCIGCRLFVADPNTGDEYEVTLPPGVVWNPDNGTLCLTNPTPGEDTLVFTATDTCGAFASETLVIAIEVGTPPALEFSSSDTTIYLCDPDTSLCFVVSATGTQPISIEEVLNPGSFNASTGEFCFNPDSVCFDNPGTVDTTICVVFRATNECGSVLDSLCITVVTKPPPVVQMPTGQTVALCEPGEVCVGPVTIFDPSGSALSIVGVGAEYRDGFLCFSPVEPGSYHVGVVVTDTCGNLVRDSMLVEVTLNQPPVISGPGLDTAGVCGSLQVCVGPYLITDPDLDGFTVTVSGGAFLNESGLLCFDAPETGSYEFVITASDSCGSSTHHVVVEVTANQPPVLEFSSSDTTIYLCDPDTFLCFVVTATGSQPITIEEVLNPGTFNASTGEFCFNPDSVCFNHYMTVDTTICVVFRATNDCGTVLDSLCVHVISKPPPVVQMPAGQSVALCAPGEVCVGPVTIFDPSSSALSIVGVGAEYRDGFLCFSPAEPGSYYVGVVVTDTCGHVVRDSMLVDVTLNSLPVIAGPAFDSVGVCGSIQVCVGPYLITDPDGGLPTIMVSGGAFLNEAGFLCFEAPETGRYEFAITASDSCGSFTQGVVVDVTANQPPVWSLVPDTTVAQCTAGDSVCITFAATDPDGDPLHYQVALLPFPEPLEVTGSTFCFIPTQSGEYLIAIWASDSCNAPVLDTARIVVSFNTPPQVTFSLPDTTISVCGPDTLICFTVSATDADGDPVELREILNPGTFDEETGQVCFNPDSICFNDCNKIDTTVCLVFAASDSCGSEIIDSLCLHIVANRRPVVQAPAPANVSLCGPGQVCVPGFVVSDPEGDPLQITVSSGGTYEGGTVCFQADEPGIYNVEVCATDPCGHSVCDTTQINVSFNSAPLVTFGPDTTVTLCAPGQLCVNLPVVTDADGDIPLLQIEGAVQSGNLLCFNATGPGTRTIVVRAVDSCGASDADTLRVTVRLNAAPRVLIRAADPLTLCDTDTTLCFAVRISDLDGSPLASLQLIKTDTRFWTLDGQNVCINAAVALADRTHGTFQAIVEATDACGAKGRDTLMLELSVNQAPFVSLPSDTVVALCEPGEICLGPVAYGDPDQLQVDVEVQGGTLVDDQICVFIAQDSVVQVVVTVTDSCGVTATDTLWIDGSINLPPTLLLPVQATYSVCALDTICVDGIEGQDPEMGRLPAELISGPGQFDPATGRLCFIPEQDGLYQFEFAVTDGCVTVTGQWAVQVSTNQRPVFQSVPETTLFVCAVSAPICLEFAATDPDGDPIHYSLLSGPGSIDPATGRLCFTPDSSGTYSFTVTASDSCGASEPVVGTASVQLNSAPALHFSSSDTSVFVCNPDTLLCFVVTATDPDGPAPVIREILNPGEFNALTGEFCFNPSDICFGGPGNFKCAAKRYDYDTTICVIFSATDTCGAEVVDTLCVHVKANDPPVVDLGPDRTMQLCQPGPVCVDLANAIHDPDGDELDIQVAAPGYLEGSQACLVATQTGRVSLIVCATDPCGLSTCDTLNIDVNVNSAPTVELPPDTTVVACVVDQVCVGPVVISDPDFSDSITVSVSGGATLVDGQLCFNPTGDGSFTFVVTVTDHCGISDVDSIQVQVDRNEPPALAFSSPDTSITLCNTDTLLCFQVVATDPDGEVPQIEEILVPGSFDPATGTFCFNPDSVCFGAMHMDTTICVVFRATDACGTSVTDSLCIEVRVNRAPVIQFSSGDTTLYVCRADTLLCFGITAFDEEGDSVEIREVVNPGEYFPELGQFCFQPSNVCYPNTPCAAGPTCVVFEAVDACGNVTRDSLCIEVYANMPPVVVAPESLTVFQCQPGDEVCVSPVYGLDFENGELPVVSAGAEYDALLKTLCFTADTTGLYRLVVSTVDDCQLSDTVEILVHVLENVAPLVVVPTDTALFLCGPDSVCLPVHVADPGDQWTARVTGPARFVEAAGVLCVAVVSEQPLTVGLEIVDNCGLTTTEQFEITPTFNRPPVVQLPDDFSVQVCLAGPYCFGPVTIGDPDFNLSGSIVVTGGTYDSSSGLLCVDASTAGLRTVVVAVTDSCGQTAQDTVVVNLTVNQPPITSFSSPDTSLFLCTADTNLCFNFSATDPDGGLVLLNEILNPGTFDPLTGDFCFNPSDICFGGPGNFKCQNKRYVYDTTICVIFSATDTCGVEVVDTLCVHVTANEPPVVVAPADSTVFACAEGSYCLSPFLVNDANGTADPLSVVSSGPAHTFNPATGVLCFTGGPGTYTFAVTATDGCGASATDSVTVTVASNQAPLVSLPPDFSTSVCDDDTVCVIVTASDPDLGDLPEIEAVLPNTSFDLATSSICFVPDTSGTYLVIARATDRCGLADLDTVRVTVNLNRAPVWLAVPEIDTFFCAPPGAICFSVSATDPDGQQLIYIKREGPGTIDSLTGRICFNPGTTVGMYNFVVTACDPCGAVVNDTAHINVRMNRPPVLAAMRDTLVSLCQSGPVCFPPLSATDPDGNTVTYTLLSGSGTLQGTQYCFTADTSGLYAVRVKATDPCGLADTVLFHASVLVNRPPTLTLPTPNPVFLCGSSEICQSGISATDVDGGPLTITKTSGPGTFNSTLGRVCFTPTAGGTYNFDFMATDTCGAQTTGRMTITVLFNRTPSLDIPDHVNVCRDSQVCFSVGAIDPDIGTRLTVTQVSGPSGTFTPNPLTGASPLSGQWCWQAQAPGSYLAVFRVTDTCGATAVDTTRIDVSDHCDTLCFAASIPAICPDAAHPDHWLFQGRSHEFPVMVTPSRAVGAFDFLIGYDASALSVQNVTRGTDISAWEFFTYRIVNPNTECGGGNCPSGLLRIVGIADINNGQPISDPSQTQPSTEPQEYAKIVFQVSNDRTLGGQFVAVDFWWNDCGDNTFSSPLGDLYVAGTIDPDTCVGAGAKELIEACATFEGGGGCIPTASDIDDIGDLNLNGLGYEISDAVLFSNYFILGQGVFDPDPIKQASQVAASDVNVDGSTLTVADLVFLIRIIVGLEEPIDPGTLRPAPAGSVAMGWSYRDREAYLELEGSVATGALALEVRTERPPQSVELTPAAQEAGMELLWRSDGDRVKVLVYSMKASSLPPGAQSVLIVRDGGRIETLLSQASSQLGSALTVNQKTLASLPEAFDLDPNFPNPFNPETEIRFTLHQSANVTLTIFNVLGQEVARLADGELLQAGPHRYRWLANDSRGSQLASGVYMYRLTAAGYSETRKMMLLR